MEFYIEFLFKCLDQFRDDKESIRECLICLVNDEPGGHLYQAMDEHQTILGVVVILNTMMKKFLPENFLVYIAVSEQARGKGIGGDLLDFAQKKLKGGICLHVEPDNPALNLYKRKGFTNKYLEMRYQP